jgi:putative ABC transport system permease protein
MLKSVGATGRQIRSTVLYEGLFLSIIGIPLGVAAGIGVEALAMPIINGMLSNLNALNNNAIHFSFTMSGEGILLSILLSGATVFMSAWQPARKAAKLPAIEAIRGGAKNKIKAKRIRTSRITRGLFGFEGELAAKNMKRSRKSYRATVLALAASVILFIVGSTFGNLLLTANSAIYPNVEATAMASYQTPLTMIFDPNSGWQNAGKDPKTTELEPAVADTITQKLRAYDGAQVKMFATNDLYSTADNGLFSASGQKAFGGDTYDVNCISLDTNYYTELCRESGTNPGDAILLNNMSIDDGNRVKAIRPFNLNGRYSLPVTSYDGRRSIEVGGELDDIPPELSMITTAQVINIIVPDIAGQSVIWLANVDDSAGFTTYAQQVLNECTKLPADSTVELSSTDIKQSIAATRGLSNLIMVFIYGFIAMLTLIGLTNVISTISTNIRLRRSEFAVLMSVGMTREGLRRTLSLESLLCGLRSLLYGVPVALVLSYVLYNSIGSSMAVPFTFPISPTFICIAAVLVVTFATMRFSASRMRNGSIIEGIRGEE